MSAFGNSLTLNVLPAVTEVAAAINRLFGIETRTRIEQINDKLSAFNAQIFAHENNGAIGSLIDDFYGFDVNLVKNRVDVLIKERDRLQNELNKPITSKRADVSLDSGTTNSTKKGVAALSQLTKDKTKGDSVLTRQANNVAARAQTALKTLRSAEIELLKVSGNQVGAVEKEITARYQSMLDNLTGQSRITGQEIVTQLINKEKLKVSLGAMNEQVNNALDDMGNKERSIDVSVNTGALSELEGRQAVLDLHKETAIALDVILQKMEAVAKVSGDPKALNGVQKVKIKVRELATEATILETHVRDSLSGAFSDVFTGIGSDVKNAGDAVRVFTLGVLESIAQIAAQELAQQSTKFVASGISALIGSFHDGGENVSASSGKKRLVNPALFARAPRFHGGLQSNEFPAILQKGEDVIARDDPRNSRFGGESTKTTIMHITTNTTIEGADNDQRKMQAISKIIKVAVTKELVKEKRPGGLLAS